MSCVPVLVTVDSCAAVGPSSMSFDPNESDVGAIDPDVWIPVPSSAIDTSAAFDCTVAVPVREPVAVGSNEMRTLHVSPAASGLLLTQSSGLLVRRVKSPVTLTSVTLTVSEPLCMTVEVCEDVLPSSRSFGPIERDAGERDSSVWVPIPV